MAPEHEREAHEAPAVKTRRVVGLTLGFVAFAILLGGTLSVYYRMTTAHETLTAPIAQFPAPQLQPNPGQDWRAFHAAQTNDLEGYGWVDRASGLVHVPIERAMAVVQGRGAQAYDPVEGTPAFGVPGGAPLDGAPRAAPTPAVAPYGEVH